MVKARSLGKVFPVDRIGYGIHFLTLTKKEAKNMLGNVELLSKIRHLFIIIRVASTFYWLWKVKNCKWISKILQRFKNLRLYLIPTTTAFELFVQLSFFSSYKMFHYHHQEIMSLQKNRSALKQNIEKMIWQQLK